MQDQSNLTPNRSPIYRADPNSPGDAQSASGFGSSGFAGAAPALQAVPPYRLYDTTSIGIAAFWGSPIAGTALMAINYRRLGQQKRATWTLVTGLVGTATVIAIAVALLPQIPSYIQGILPVILFVMTYQAGKALQGPIIQRHVAQGGELSSRWGAFGLSVVLTVAMLAVIYGGFYAYYLGVAAHATVKIGAKDNVTFSGTATKQDALKLGETLKQIGYFRDQGVSVFVAKGDGVPIVSFVVINEAWTQPDKVSAFERIGLAVAPSVGGLPIKVRLIDSSQAVKKEMNVGEVISGTKDELYYFGSATETDAKALAQSLKSGGFFVDRGVSVFLAKGDDGTSITFICEPNIAADPAYVAQFETLVRNSAASVGGLPIQLRLASTSLETEKAENVN